MGRVGWPNASKEAVWAVAQFLESYKSVTLESMARAFGVSVDFIDRELVDFIVAGRLPAKIDKVHFRLRRMLSKCIQAGVAGQHQEFLYCV
jgi:hypothetical protein